MRVGDWVEITKYDGPHQNLNIVGALVRVTGVDKDDVSLLAVAHTVSNGYGQKVPLIVKSDEVRTVPIDARDANNTRINIGDEVAYAVYGGALNQGKVTGIIPRRASYYNYLTKERTAKIDYSLRVEVKGSRSFANYSQPYDAEKSRRVSFEAPSIRRVGELSRVLVVKQKDPVEVNNPLPGQYPFPSTFPSWPSQPLHNQPSPWPGNGIQVTHGGESLTANV
jgi:hypothetical protein